jgi:hypothetical protein
MNKKIAISVSLIAIVLIGVYAMFKGSEYTVEITQEQIQEAIDKQMPFEKSFAFIFNLSASNTKVILTEGSERIGASTDIGLNVKVKDVSKDFGGSVLSSTAIRYDKEQSRFYLQDPLFDDIQVEGLADKYEASVLKGVKKVMGLYLTDVPVYTIKDDNMKMKLAKAFLKNVGVSEGRLVITLGY